MADFTGKIHTSAPHYKYNEKQKTKTKSFLKSQNGRLFCISTAVLITNITLTSWGNEMIFTEKIEKE